MRVLDTAALLYWPVTEITGGICSVSQLSELQKVSAQRHMLVSNLDINWQEPVAEWLENARTAAANSGDLPRLSSVDLDILALAMGLDLPLFTDDYRLQNTMQMAGLATHPVGAKGAKQVWQWELRCTGCGSTEAVPPDVESRKTGPVKDCASCGAPMVLKRKR